MGECSSGSQTAWPSRCGTNIKTIFSFRSRYVSPLELLFRCCTSGMYTWFALVSYEPLLPPPSSAERVYNVACLIPITFTNTPLIFLIKVKLPLSFIKTDSQIPSLDLEGKSQWIDSIWEGPRTGSPFSVRALASLHTWWHSWWRCWCQSWYLPISYGSVCVCVFWLLAFVFCLFEQKSASFS